MNETDRHISGIVSPFDDDNTEQVDVTGQGYIEFEKDEILKSIRLKNSRVAFDLYLSELLTELDQQDQVLFIGECFDVLVGTYSLCCLHDYVKRENLINQNSSDVKSLLEYICLDRWLDTMIPKFPIMSLDIIVNRERLYDYLKSNIDTLKKSILSNNDVHDLIKYQIEYAPIEECVGFLFKLLQKDIAGVVSVQVVVK